MGTLSDQAPIIARALSCGISDWNQIWGDPIISGTLFMLAYGTAAFLILSVARHLTGREWLLWLVCGGLFLFQVANTHLDLHAFIFTFGRCLAHDQGWYDNRHEVQLAVITIGSIIAILVLLVLMLLFRRHLLGNMLLIAGVGIALGMTVTKGINYHYLEQHYSSQIGPFRGADLIEFAGIFIAMSAAVFRRRTIVGRSQ